MVAAPVLTFGKTYRITYNIPSWIDDDMAELRRQQETAAELRVREGTIASESATIYDDLWTEILMVIEEADQKGLPGILVDGASYKRKIIVPGMPKHGERFYTAQRVHCAPHHESADNPRQRSWN